MKIHVPGMKNEMCARIVENAIRSLPGVVPREMKSDSVTIDLAARTVTVTYESLGLGWKNIELAVADAGFAANDMPANPEAVKKLPAECR